MEAASNVRVLIVEDDYYAREAMRNLLAKDRRTHVWGTAEDVDDACNQLRAARAPQPDVVLLDVRLGEAVHGGIEGIPSIREASPSSKVLITSVSKDEETVLSAIRAGADGYVWKNESAEGIANAIVGVHEGRFVVTSAIAERLLGKTLELSSYATEIMKSTPAQRELTDSLRKTIYLYCVSGMSAKEIADELTISVNTVNSRIRLAYQILGAASRQEAFRRLIEGPEA